jgi:hypothetical protein
MTLEGKVALVTGASGGIGRSIAERLASDGATVVVNYYPPERDNAEDVVRGIEEDGGTAVAAAADAAQLRGLFDVAQQGFGRLDIVVLNAANVRHGSIVDTSDEEFDAMFAQPSRGIGDHRSVEPPPTTARRHWRLGRRRRPHPMCAGIRDLGGTPTQIPAAPRSPLRRCRSTHRRHRGRSPAGGGSVRSG